MTSRLKIMVVDDTITYRLILKEVLKGIPHTEVTATAIHGEDALQKLAECPVDLVLLDLEMPRLNGIETMREVRKRYPELGVVMISGTSLGSANMTMQALEAGAMDFIAKPDGQNASENVEELRARLRPIINNMLANIITPRKTLPEALKPQSAPSVPLASKPINMQSTHFDVLAIGVSTGGPKALMELIPNLPGDLGVPILIVQHMPPLFTASLAESLARHSQMGVKEAVDMEPVMPNQIYLAPGGYHMGIQRNSIGMRPSIKLNQDPPENSCRPAVDVLFRSIGQVYGKNILAVVMTGMGSDGAKGVQGLKKFPHCYCLTQSAESCVIYGMPKAVDDLGLSDEKVPLQNIAERITSLIKGGNRFAGTT